MPDIKRFKNQKYRDIVRASHLMGVQFSDPEFPPSLKSLFDDRRPPAGLDIKKIEWKRASEIVTDPQLIVHRPDPRHVVQGVLGNCWLISSVGLIAAHADLLDKIIPSRYDQEWILTRISTSPSAPPVRPLSTMTMMELSRQSKSSYSHSRAGSRASTPGGSPSTSRRSSISQVTRAEFHPGVFRFRFYRFGEWVEVVVDDYLPMINGEYLGAHSTRPNEFWIALLEKAYAKLNNSYIALDFGHSADALVDLTGAIPQYLNMCEMPEDELFGVMSKVHSRNGLMSCSINLDEGNEMGFSADRTREQETEDGLIIGHAYGVMDIREFIYKETLFQPKKTLRLVRLRNPWGDNHFLGELSALSQKELKKLPRKLQKMLKDVEDVQGDFFMTFDEFYQRFESLVICRKINTSFWTLRRKYHAQEFYGTWSPAINTSGGCVNYKTFPRNPQYKFVINDRPADIMISLMQRDRRTTKQHEAEHITIGFVVMRVEENRALRVHRVYPVSGTTTYLNCREIFGRFHLDPGHYILVPTTFEPGKEASFLLRIFTDRRIPFESLHADIPKRKWFRKDPVGVLRVTILNADGLSSQRLIGHPKLYTSISSSESRKLFESATRTSMKPTFDSSFVFYIRNPDKARITIKLWDRNTMMPDSFMGMVKFNLGELLNNDSGKVKERCGKDGNKSLEATMKRSLKERGCFYFDDVHGQLRFKVEWTEGLVDC